MLRRLAPVLVVVLVGCVRPSIDVPESPEAREVLEVGPIGEFMAQGEAQASCAEEEVSLTGGHELVWVLGPGVRFHGTAGIVVCEAARPELSDELLSRLGDEFDAAVSELGFDLADLCAGASGLTTLQRFDVLRRQFALRSRFVDAAPQGLVRGLTCTFGWVHVRDGRAASGVG